MATETRDFQAEVQQLLRLMIHSLYSNREIFLRELISNASDAIDRLRFLALSDPDVLENDSNYAIHVEYDKDAGTVSIHDNGIGMSYDEVIANIGSIAKSGTREFLQTLSEDKKNSANAIGQFGVGFYSSFVVADKVVLFTRRAGLAPDEGVRWESAGEGTYTIEREARETRGTTVVLHIRQDDADLLNGYTLRNIIRKYSDHINVPIFMKQEGGEAETSEEEQVNQAAALWTRSRSDLKEADYFEFYKHMAYDSNDPLLYLHTKLEGAYEYTLLLFIPSTAPFDFWSTERRSGIKLYVKRVFIMDNSEHLMPRYLRFVRGVIDSNDLPLNVSREILQQNRVIEIIKNNAVKRVLGALSDMAEKDPAKYQTFWKEFGRAMKEGIMEDHANRETIAKLARFTTSESASEEQTVSLADYISRMKEGQDKIYYNVAETYQAANRSPHLEIFRKKGIEVLLLSDPIDHFITAEMRTFEGKEFQSVTRGEIDLSNIHGAEEDTESEDKQTDENTLHQLEKRLKTLLDNRIKDVKTSSRLTDSPACLIQSEEDLDPSLQRLLKSTGQMLPTMKPILEINPSHTVIQNMLRIEDDTELQPWAEMLYGQCMLSMGEHLEDPTLFVNAVNKLLGK